MTKKQLLKKLIPAIHKACPEILELKFGCKIEVLFDELEKETGYKGIYRLLSNDYGSLKVSGKKTGCLILNKSKSDFKILGRTIRLFDILKVFEKKNIPLRVDADGELIKFADVMEAGDDFWEGTDIFWVKQNDLTKQSLATLKLLVDCLNL